MKLKVYKGTSLVNENTIIDLPTGVATFYMDIIEPRVPGSIICLIFLIHLALSLGNYIHKIERDNNMY